VAGSGFVIVVFGGDRDGMLFSGAGVAGLAGAFRLRFRDKLFVSYTSWGRGVLAREGYGNDYLPPAGEGARIGLS
jgi:hypothetical protein